MSVVAVLMAVVILWVEVLNPSVVSASELLTRAVAAQNPPASPSSDARVRVARQTVQIHSRNRTVTREFEWTIGNPIPPARWNIESNPLNWNAPLTAGAFADWRDSLQDKKDKIKRSGYLLTLGTTTAQSSVREAWIVVRANDFRPVEQHLRWGDDRQLDLTETGFEIIDQPKPKLSRLPQRELPLRTKKRLIRHSRFRQNPISTKRNCSSATSSLLTSGTWART